MLLPHFRAWSGNRDLDLILEKEEEIQAQRHREEVLDAIALRAQARGAHFISAADERLAMIIFSALFLHFFISLLLINSHA